MNPKDGSEGTIVPPAESGEATEATTDQPGKNTKYGAEAVEEEPPQEEAVEEQAPEEQSWIVIELVDLNEKPVVGAKYLVTASDGEEHDGTLDADGRARIEPIAAGTAKITFPQYDRTSPRWSCAAPSCCLPL